MLVSVPASSANLGPGFDTLAVALPKRLKASVEQSSSFELIIQNEGADKKFTQEELEDHIVAKVLKKIHGHSRFRVNVDSNIPLARGLGSSAALILAVAAASGVEKPLDLAAEIEGHADNVTAAFNGGLVSVLFKNNKVIFVELPLDPRLEFILVIPEFELSTESARQVLPDTYLRRTLSESLGHFGLMVAGLGDIDKFNREAFVDLIHQPYRTKIYPESEEIIELMIKSGAIGAVWSGAGSSIIGFCNANSKIVCDRFKKLTEGLEYDYTAESLTPDKEGLKVIE